MGQLLGAALLIIILGSILDAHYYGNRYAAGYAVYQSNTSATGYAVNRRYYDMETGDTYAASTPVYLVAANTYRVPRGTIYYSNDVPPYGVYPRSY